VEREIGSEKGKKSVPDNFPDRFQGVTSRKRGKKKRQAVREEGWSGIRNPNPEGWG